MIINMILKAIDENSEAMAVVSASDSLTYHQLGSNALTMSKHLADAGINKGKVVALFSDRSAVTITAMVAVMLTGAAYTVVEEEENLEENRNRLCSLEADLVLCAEKHTGFLTQANLQVMSYEYCQRLKQTFTPQHPLAKHQLQEQDIAYVLYTSGSTGKPKGVEVTHSNVTHYTQSIQQRLQLQRPLRYAHLSTLAADLGNTSLFLCLATGGCLHLLGGKVRKDPRQVLGYFQQHQIEFLKITPSHWRAIFAGSQQKQQAIPALEYLLFGGEALPKTLAQDVLDNKLTKQLFNHYGPTETTIGVTVFHVKDHNTLDAIEGDTVPIGTPFGDTQTFILDEHDNFQDANCEGELYITGPSVARGYRNRPEASEKSFITIDPSNTKTLNNNSLLRAYKTGDRVKVDQQGVIYFKGRIDRQIKVNGYRVELEHIENTIKQIANVKDTVVVYPEIRGKKMLIAAIVSERYGESIDNIKHLAADLMPEYMIPKRFIYMLDLPRNANGKTNVKLITQQLIEAVEQEYLQQDSTAVRGGTTKTYQGKSLELYQLIKPVFLEYLKLPDIDPEASFIDLGGDSLESIQLIADLQYKGLDISANEFMENPTLDGVIQAVQLNDRQQSHASGSEQAATHHTETRQFSAAQDHFFKQNLASPNHYNQAVFFRTDTDINLEHLQEAIQQTCDTHELLHTKFNHKTQGDWVAKRLPAPTSDVLSSTDISGLSLSEQRQIIESTASKLQASIDIATGRVFLGHVFSDQRGCDYLLLIAHHLCIDVISWRIIINEISRHYGDCQQQLASTAPIVRQRFWDWSQHLDEAFKAFTPEIAPSDTQPSNITESQTQSYWFGYTAKQTQQLIKAAANSDLPLHLLVLSSLAQVTGQAGEKITLDVESHGRVSLAPQIDVSRVVGWHTSTFPLTVDVAKDITVTQAHTQQAFDNIEHLGVGYGVHHKHAAHSEPTSNICFNFLGDTDFNHDNHLPLQSCTYAVGTTRGPDNRRSHDIKVSARITHQQLIVDVSYPTPDPTSSTQASANNDLALHLHQQLNALLSDGEDTLTAVTEPGSKTGMLHYVPDALLEQSTEASVSSSRQYQHILLTGATGYIGSYALRELLKKTQAKVYCLIRPKANASAEERLQATLDNYFAGEDFQPYADRIQVISGDLRQANWQLESSHYQELSENIDAVYHFAADTRLMGSEEELAQANIAPLKQLLDFCRQRHLKDMHYMSTLAVCGVNPQPEAATFNEDTLDFGQEFQNSYEKTKFECEKLVNRFTLDGNQGFIYRTGNVSGHSVTAQFQRNAADNRLIQFLNACVQLGRLPHDKGESIALSPVDKVTEGVISLSLDKQVKPDTYHVDSTHTVSMTDLFRSIERKGIHFKDSNAENFRALFQQFKDNKNPDVVLGRFWSSRKPRNVTFNHQKTDRYLKRLGVEFSPINHAWLSSFVGQLIQKNAIKRPNAEIVHIDQHRRRRIFDIPTAPSFPREAS